jgi:hypothetical protein
MVVVVMAVVVTVMPVIVVIVMMIVVPPVMMVIVATIVMVVVPTVVVPITVVVGGRPAGTRIGRTSRADALRRDAHRLPRTIRRHGRHAAVEAG